jgi:glutamine synthetase
MGIKLKYAHGEVGNILEDERQLVQHEIEFWPAPLEQAADALVVAKWVVREVASSHGLEVTFAPSVSSNGDRRLPVGSQGADCLREHRADVLPALHRR